MTPDEAIAALRSVREHLPQRARPEMDDAIHRLRQEVLDAKFPDPWNADANKVVRIIHFVEVPRDAKMDETIAAFSAGIGEGGQEGTAKGVTARFRELRITDPVPEVIVIGRPK